MKTSKTFRNGLFGRTFRIERAFLRVSLFVFFLVSFIDYILFPVQYIYNLQSKENIIFLAEDGLEHHDVFF